MYLYVFVHMEYSVWVEPRARCHHVCYNQGATTKTLLKLMSLDLHFSGANGEDVPAFPTGLIPPCVSLPPHPLQHARLLTPPQVFPIASHSPFHPNTNIVLRQRTLGSFRPMFFCRHKTPCNTESTLSASRDDTWFYR